MLNVNELLALVAAHKWIALAAVVIAFVVRMLKDDTALPTVKARWRPWLAIGLGVISGVLEKVSDGVSWKAALLGGMLAAIAAIAGHDLLIEGVRGGKELPVWPKLPPTAGMLVLLAGLALTACGLFGARGALFGLHASECVVENVIEHPERTPAEIAINCGEQLTPEFLELITKARAAQARALAAKASQADAGPKDAGGQ